MAKSFTDSVIISRLKHSKTKRGISMPKSHSQIAAEKTFLGGPLT
jgi:hypothetical protein